MPALLLFGVLAVVAVAATRRSAASARAVPRGNGRRRRAPEGKPDWVRWQAAQAVRTCDPDIIEQTAATLEAQGYDADGKLLRHIAEFIEGAPRFVKVKACMAIGSLDVADLVQLQRMLIRANEPQAADIVQDVIDILQGAFGRAAA